MGRRGVEDADLSASLFSRYSRIMRHTLFGVVAGAAILVWLQVDQALQAQKRQMVQAASEQAVALNAVLRTSTDSVNALRFQAQDWFRVTPVGLMSPLLDALIATASSGLANLDDPPAPWTTANIGNLTGSIGQPDASFRREIRMALALNSTFMAIRENSPSIAWVYYISARRFINMYPWVPSSEFQFSPALLDKAFFLGGLPENNRQRTVFWSDIYLDEGGKGLMITAAAPVDEADVFRGTVALDMTLAHLNNLVRGWARQSGTLLVVNDRDQIVADSAAEPGKERISTLREMLPTPLRDDADTLLGTASEQLVLHGDSYVIIMPLKSAPFRLVLMAPRSALLLSAAGSSLAGALLLAFGLALIQVVSIRLTRREFIWPAQQLVHYIQAESEGPAMTMPHVPAPWRPWFETIRRVFNAHTRLVSIQQELDVARRMQQSILATRFPSRPDLQMFARMIPAKEVGGDFYDYFWIDDTHVGLVIADVSGKGVPAALFMAVARTLLRATAPTAGAPGRCLRVTNDLLAQDNDAVMFVTLFYGVLDVRTGQMIYANGGHNPPYVLSSDGAVTQVPRQRGMALGVMEGVSYDEGSVILPHGATLLLYTDGVTEAFDAEEREFTTDRLVDALQGCQQASVEQVIGQVVQAVEEFAAGAPQADDITCLAVRYLGPSFTDHVMAT